MSRNLLNWAPQKNLEDMCRDGWKWFENSEIKNLWKQTLNILELLNERKISVDFDIKY